MGSPGPATAKHWLMDAQSCAIVYLWWLYGRHRGSLTARRGRWEIVSYLFYIIDFDDNFDHIRVKCLMISCYF